jgi:hypothetical protein
MYDEAGEASGPLTPSDYDFVIQDAKYKPTSTGKDMYVIKAVVESGPSKNKAVWHNFVVSPESPAAMEVFFRQMSVLGMGKDFWKRDPSNEQIVNGLKGRRFCGTVEVRPYNGVDRNDIKVIKAPKGAAAGGSTPPPPPPPPPAPAPVAAATPPPPAPAPAPPAPAPVPVAEAPAPVPAPEPAPAAVIPPPPAAPAPAPAPTALVPPPPVDEPF